jgi:hypothetical protein
MTQSTDFEEQDDIVVRIDRTWRSLNTSEIRLLLLEARSEIKSLRRSVEIQTKLRNEASTEVGRLQDQLERRR